MSKRTQDELLTGNYDGIQEYDNDLPRWWIQLFYLTIIFSVIYTVYVHFMGTPTDHERVAQQLADLKAVQTAYEQAHAPKVEGADVLLALAAKPEVVAKGQGVFAGKCAACHGAKGEGLVGPNLTDEYWLHGGKIEQIHTVIEVGVPEKGMMSWKALMPKEDIDAVTAYIWSIRHTNVPGKAPQGDKD